MRPVSLTAVRGISRLRDKGGAETESMYDLVNGYRTAAATVRNRPGTEIHTILPTGTKGLVGFDGLLHVFSAEPVTMTDTNYRCHILRHPTDLGRSLAVIHFAAPFMGFLYVSAEFDNGDIYHYWLEDVDAWEAETAYQTGDRIRPTVENGFMYVATRLDSAGTPWAPLVARTTGEVIEPTEDNGYSYECIATTGVNPTSGSTEPDWPAEEGAVVVELSDGEPVVPPTPVDTSPTPVGGGYTNPGGTVPRRRDDAYFLEP